MTDKKYQFPKTGWLNPIDPDFCAGETKPEWIDTFRFLMRLWAAPSMLTIKDQVRRFASDNNFSIEIIEEEAMRLRRGEASVYDNHK